MQSEGEFEVIASIALIGSDREATAEVCDGLAKLSLGAEGVAQVVVRYGGVGIRGESPPVVGDRLFDPPCREENSPEVDVRLGVLGLADNPGKR